MKFLTTLAGAVVFLGGCSTRQTPLALPDLFSTTDSYALTELTSASAALQNPTKITLVDSLLIVSQPQNDHLFSCINTTTEQPKGVFAPRGKSGYELLMVSTAFCRNRAFGAYDPMLKRVVWFDAIAQQDSMPLKPDRVVDFTMPAEWECRLLQATVPLPNGDYITECSKEGNERFARVDATGTAQTLFGQYPQDIANIPDKKLRLQKALMHCGFMAVCQSTVLHATHNRDELLFYKIPTNGEVPELIQQYDFGVPDDRTDEAFMASFDAAASDSLFFVLYRGKWFKELNLKFDAEVVLVFDAEGKPVVKLLLNKPVYGIAVTPDAGTLYAVGNDPKSGEPKLYKTSLSLKQTH